ncbi:MAG TPA: hypothetical protein VKD69_02845 [Vicinamibacterales bacterium]|nr:hypothetical protein [Vicinamibacterales bacterium]
MRLPERQVACADQPLIAGENDGEFPDHPRPPALRVDHPIEVVLRLGAAARPSNMNRVTSASEP